MWAVKILEVQSHIMPVTANQKDRFILLLSVMRGYLCLI